MGSEMCIRDSPNANCCSEAGHATSSMGWLKSRPNANCCKEAGQATFLIVRLNVLRPKELPPNEIRLSRLGHITSSRQALNLPSNCMKSTSATTLVSRDSSSISAQAIHTTPRARSDGTRVVRTPLLIGIDNRSTGAANSLRGVYLSTVTHKVLTPRQAMQNFSETSCRCFVGRYDPRSDEALCSAMVNASRHKFLPVSRGWEMRFTVL